VKNCKFFHNEMGLLTDNRASTTVELYNNEFAYSTATSNRGYTHNVYIGRNGLLIAEGNYSHHADGGHLFKSRAAVNIIRYNRFTDENDPATSRASYELDLPDGGQALVVGNVFGQSAYGDNTTLVSFARENAGVWPSNELYAAHNTFLNDRSSTSPLLGADPSAKIVWQNNLLQSNLSFSPSGTIVAQGGNATFTAGQLDGAFLPDAVSQAALSGSTVAPSDSLLPAALTSRGGSMTPTQQYQHPASTSGIVTLILPGAVQIAGSASPPVPQPAPSPTVTSTPGKQDVPVPGDVTSPPAPTSAPTPTLAAGGGLTGGLASTGSSATVAALVALVVLLAGGALVVSRRILRRRTL
jgi:hypothetical protein